ncbi:MAG TPA: hypothetical protein VGQ37_26395 [Vicinamibacterales bacterium]|jgi:hypothetical protein|nr:hypothetical protein [Vicinamibacterales bacterium]
MLPMLWLQQNPIVVEVAKQPPPTRDASVDAVLSIFALAGVFLLAAAVGSVLVAGGIVLYKRWKGTPESDASHTRLRI